MASQRVRLTKKIFMALKPGQYIINNTLPPIIEKVSRGNLETNWGAWKRESGRIVMIFDRKEELVAEMKLRQDFFVMHLGNQQGVKAEAPLGVKQ